MFSVPVGKRGLDQEVSCSGERGSSKADQSSSPVSLAVLFSLSTGPGCLHLAQGKPYHQIHVEISDLIYFLVCDQAAVERVCFLQSKTKALGQPAAQCPLLAPSMGSTVGNPKVTESGCCECRAREIAFSS